MPDGDASLTIDLVERIDEVPAAAWDACAGPANPFVSHAFLKALEDSGSVGGRSGWEPRHLVASDADGRVVAAAPLYIKGHSYGEYVFDHGWAQAYERAGGNYYPKLQVAVPFTPVPGPRLLLRDPSNAALREAMIAALAEVAESARLSSVHVTFMEAADAEAFRAAGWLIREGMQFHWRNEGYASFDAFLAALSHGKRKAIRKERREVAEQGITHRIVSGAAIEPAHWDAFFRFYIATSDRKWGAPYLTREFFDRLGATMADRVALVLAECDGRPIAGALNLIGADTLYGRNWGCIGHFKHLHFETCYYQAIELAIARGLARVEAGAQGEHKIQRGYLPVATHSAHWIVDPALRAAVAHYLTRETPAVAAERDALGDTSPFRHPDPQD